MDLNTIETIGIALAVVAFITVRQCLWQSVDLAKLLRMPVLFGVFGVINLVNAVGRFGPQWRVQPIDLAVILTELALGVLAGWLMGRWTQIRTIDGRVQSRLFGPGIAVWLGFLAVRIALAAFAHAMNATVADQTGTILLVVAVIKAIQALRIRERINQHQADQRSVERQRSYTTLGV